MKSSYSSTVHSLTAVKPYCPAMSGKPTNRWLESGLVSNAIHALKKMPYDDQVNSLIGDHPSPGRLVRVFFHRLEFPVHYYRNIMMASFLRGLRHVN